MRILIVEDEVKLAALLRRGLTEEAHAADVAATGEDALWMAQATAYDAIVLDLMLPGHRRSRGLPAPARGRRVVAGADARRRGTRSRIASAGSTPAPTTT